MESAVIRFVAFALLAAVLLGPIVPSASAQAASSGSKGKGGTSAAGDVDDLTRRIERELDRITSGLERDRQARDKAIKAAPGALPANSGAPARSPQ